jgi:ribonuclease P protein component
MRFHVVGNALGVNRAVFVPVRSYPNAVARNRAKRVARECWRLARNGVAAGRDVAIVLFPGSDELDARRAQFDRLSRQAGLRT